MLSLIGPIIKAGLIGGSISGCIYGTYKLALDISSTTIDGSGFDVFEKFNSVSTKIPNLNSISAAIKMFGDEGLSNIITNQSAQLSELISNPEKQEIVTKVFTGCVEIKNKDKISCKNVSGTLSILIKKLSSTDPQPNRWWLPKKTPATMTTFLQTAKSEELINYLDKISIIEETTDTLFGKNNSEWSSGVSDSLSAMYTWWKSSQHENKQPASPGTPAPSK